MSAKLWTTWKPAAAAMATTSAIVGVIVSASAWSVQNHGNGRPAAPPLQPGADSAGPGSLIENYAYPDADQILASTNVKLTYGNGLLLMADCATESVDNVSTIKVRTSDIKEGNKGLICFKVIEPTGYLRLEVPGVYEIHGDGDVAGAGHKVTATVKNEDQTFDPAPIPPSGYLHVGLGAGDDKPTTLLELKGTP
jgi:hypothetical protein